MTSSKYLISALLIALNLVNVSMITTNIGSAAVTTTGTESTASKQFLGNPLSNAAQMAKSLVQE